jgi:hypothetical protein
MTFPFWERCLRRVFSHKELGWTEIGERFTRFTLLKTRWFTIYLHKLYSPNPHPDCHDHPWSFVTFILKGGYYEETKDGVYWRAPGSVLYRPAEFAHNVITKADDTCWSIVITSRKRRGWGFIHCGRELSRIAQRNHA